MDRSMYILRVHYRNGRMLDYNFADLALAQSSFKLMCDAKASGVNAQFSDQAGRIADISGGDVDTLTSRDIVVSTPEKLDFALRSDPDLLDDVGLIVLDE